jgi:flagellar hook assembly protein FlgD
VLFRVASESGPVTLSVYDVSGRRLRSLAERALPAGVHAADWDGRDERGRRVAAGNYVVRLTSPAGQLAIARVLVVR